MLYITCTPIACISYVNAHAHAHKYLHSLDMVTGLKDGSKGLVLRLNAWRSRNNDFRR